MRYGDGVRITFLLALVALAGCNFRIDAIEPGGVGGGGSGDGVGGGGSGDGGDDGGVPFGFADLANAGDDLAHGGPFLELAAVPSPAAVDLTAEGTSDWVHWGYSSASDFDHKATGNAQISSFQQVGINAPTQYGDNLVIYRWDDGLNGNGRHAATSQTGTTTGVYVLTGGLSISAPADTTARRLRVYVGQLNATGQLDVSLSDNSAPAVSDHSYTSMNGNAINVEYVITYRASSPGQVVKVNWTILNSSLGNVTLQSATLQGPLF
jgi:hypothetical protein